MGETSVLGELLVRLGLDAKAFDEAMGKVEGKVQGLEKNMASLGKSLTTKVSAPLIAAGAVAVKVANDFDKAYATIRAGTGATGETLEGLKAVMNDLYKELPNDLDQVATAVADLNTMFGVQGEELEAMATQYLNLARITGSDVSSLIQDAARLFGDWTVATEDQSDALDFLFRVTQSTGTEIGKLSQLMVQYGAPLRQMGFDFETAAALMGKFHKVGVNTELVLGSLRIALGTMAREGVTDASEALQILIEDIKNAGSVGEANAKAIEVFGARAGPDMAAAIREGRFEIDGLLASLLEGTDTINGVGEETLTFSDSLKQLKHAVELAIQPLGVLIIDTLIDNKGALEDVIGVFSNLVEAFKGLPDPVESAMVKIALMAAALGPVLYLSSKLIGLLAGVKAAVVAASGAMTTMSLSSAAAAAGVSTLATAAATLGLIGVAIGGIIAGAIAIDKLISEGVNRGIIDGYESSLEEIERYKREHGYTEEGYIDYTAEVRITTPNLMMDVDPETLEEQVHDAIIAKTGGKFRVGIPAEIVTGTDEVSIWDAFIPSLDGILETAKSKIKEIEQEQIELEAELNEGALLEQADDLIKDLQDKVYEISISFGEGLASETARMGETLTSSIRSELSSLLDKGKTGLTKDEKARLAELQEMEKAFDIKTSGGLGNLTNILSTSLRPENLAALGLGEDVIEAIQGEPLKTAIDQLQTEQKIAQLAYAQAGQLAQQYNLTAEQKASLESYLANVYGQAVGFEASVLSAVADVSLAIRELDLSVTVNVDPWEGTYSTDGSVPLASPTGSAQAAGGASSALGPQKDVTVANPEEASLLEEQNMLLEDIKAELQKTYSPANPSNDNLIWRLALI